VSLPIGGQIFFTKKAEGVSFLALGGIIINSVDGLLEMGRINCGASLLKIGSIEYNLVGELV
jgi:RNA-splicing ligase RtcB